MFNLLSCEYYDFNKNFSEYFYNLIKIDDKYINFIYGDKIIYEIVPLIKKYPDSKNIWLNIFKKLNKNNKIYNYDLNIQSKTWDNICNESDPICLYTLTEENLKLLYFIFKNNYNIEFKDTLNFIFHVFENKIIVLSNNNGLIYGNTIYKIVNNKELLIYINNKLFNIIKILEDLTSYITNKNNKKIILSLYKNLNKILDKNKNIIIQEILNNFKNKNIVINNHKPNLLALLDHKMIDLKTSIIHTRTHKNIFTDFCRYNFQKTYEITRTPSFIKDIFYYTKDKNIINSFQKILGYVLTGENKEQCYIIIYGTGANGKTTLLNILQKILGNLSLIISLKELNSKNPIELINRYQLNNKRLCIINDCEKNIKIDEEKINILTNSCSKIIISSNYKPMFNINLYTDIRRIVYIPFETTFVETDTINQLNNELTLNYDLNIDYDEMFTWIVNGANKFYKEGIKRDLIIRETRNNFIKDIDPIYNFIINNISKSDNINDKIKSNILYQNFLYYCTEDVEIDNKKFTQILKEKGYINKKYIDGTYWIYIKFIY